MTLQTVSILFFLTGFLLILGIYQSRQPGGSENVSKRVKKLQKNIKSGEIPEKKQEEEKIDPLRKLLKSFGQSGLLTRMGRGMDKKLEESDVLLSGGEFMVLVMAGFFITFGMVISLTLNFWWAIAIGVIMSFTPFFLVNRARHKRLSSFNSQICDALVVMSNSLRSGFSFLQSMDMVRKEMPDPIAKEFNRTFREVNLGTSTEKALQNLAHRVNSDDLDLVVTAVLIQRQVGGNLAEVLDKIAGTIRERVRIQGEIRTLTAQGRISGLIIGLLPVILALFMLAINPGYIQSLFHHPIGLMMVSMAVFGEIIGFVMIRKIIQIRV
ncbi:MAG: secretion system protein [Tindallia sp. MSAO_Bac2]|nr:MAG: secretion system protein [Tindallia sp. MSAO_Bac2]